MSVFFYNIFLFAYKLFVHAAVPFNSKAKKWVSGRKGIFNHLQKVILPEDKVIWMHCASLGEFEQGRPVLEKINQQYPAYKILLTFFSPSGYEVQQKYAGADWIIYLPLDGKSVSKQFLKIVHPSLVIFVKYEYWYYYLQQIKKEGIPIILISALIRNKKSPFGVYERLMKKMLGSFNFLFLQDDLARQAADEMGLGSKSIITGDTRFDRVMEIAEKFEPIAALENFIGNNKIVVAGSTWPEDEILLKKAIEQLQDPALKIIIAPHEINERHLRDIEKLFPGSLLYSSLKNNKADSPNNTVLIIDNIGLLSRIYRYATIAYVGGGLTTYGVHNVLEAAVYCKPVLFGPFYEKYLEAIGLVKCSGGIVIKHAEDLSYSLNSLLKNVNGIYEKTGYAAGQFVKSNGGATNKILSYIQENRLLTS